ncbi:D-alanyl-D-alanine carboxypeptidase/D-alanyl-D-alanine-endopeptidase (penicillin-binding protein 4) [Pedobacter sp. CG_S7]|uniref:D-alanyl-D-alanine carboxypeptidase/D-alanyl-D-alanine endopeptidase n=1 Tax=Pedobacter sp. CG_S7 TaxID=3143930 RepID=UPI0033985C1F
MKLKCQILLASLILLHTLAIAQNQAQKLEQAYKVLSADPQAKYALTSLCVLDANTGQVIFARNENIGMATASTLKTITAATAFSLLGKNFQYQTILGYSGTISNGVLKGDLIIVGGGDPTLGSSRYAQSKENEVLSIWVKAIKAAGINKIDGRIIGDDSAWGTSNIPDGWTWQDIGNYYGAAPSVLTWRENQFDIYLKANAKVDQPVSILKVQPEMPYLKIVNELKTGPVGSGDNAYAFLPPLSSIAYLRGSWGLGIRKNGIAVALPDPAYEVAYRLQDTLKRLGIASTKEVTTARKLKSENQLLPSPTHQIATINSPTVSQIIYWFNKKSINLYGENLIRTLAWKAGKPATTANGIVVAINYWKEKGIDKNALNMIDGSGLSPATRVTTSAMANILFQSQREPWFDDFKKSLPENNGMQLKSGSINNVSSFAGYYTNSAGMKYIVVININNYSGSGINKKLFKALDALK